MAATPTNPLNYAGAHAPPLATPAGGTITIGPTTYAVSSIGAVQVQTTLEPRDDAGWCFLIGCVLAGFLLLAGGVGTVGAFVGDGMKREERIGAYLILALGVLLSPSFWLVVRYGPRTIYQLALFIGGSRHVYNMPSHAAAFEMRNRIAAAMAANSGNVFIDARQVHIHKGG